MQNTALIEMCHCVNDTKLTNGSWATSQMHSKHHWARNQPIQLSGPDLPNVEPPASYLDFAQAGDRCIPTDALKAFKMNKSDGGKQHSQRDTVIPDSTPFPEHRGETQKMTLSDGWPKVLECILTK